MTNFETSCDADPVCANMFPPQCGAGGTCGKPRLSSLSWRQLECWRRWREFAELNGAKTDKATTEASTGIPDTNLLQRLNGEIKRRTDVVGIFPNEAACHGRSHNVANSVALDQWATVAPSGSLLRGTDRGHGI